MSDNGKDIEVQDARARIKELEDQLNEKMVENTNTHLKIKEANDRTADVEKNLEIMKNEYQWLTQQYDDALSLLYDQLDELCHKIKHSNYTEVIATRNKKIMDEREKQAKELANAKQIKPGEPIPKGYEPSPQQ
jgi:predicted  nucleic acid-binding Zn-ribbon protein